MSRKRSITVTAWYYFANLSGAAMISFAVSWAILQLTAKNGPVIARTSEVELLTPKVPFKGTLRYVYDSERYESCAGEVVYVATSQTNHGPPATVTFRRPIAAVEIKAYPDIPSAVYLPESMFPARWHFISAVHSRCPTRERMDKLAEFEFEVTPP